MEKFSFAAAGPEQYWINLGATPDVMVVGWVTSDKGAASTVQFGTAPGSYTHTATGNASFYKYSSKYTSGLIHHVPLTGLAPATVYYYKVAGGSEEFSFTSSPGVGAFFPYVFGVFADIGENNDAASTVAHMIEGSKGIDSYILNGDIRRVFGGFFLFPLCGPAAPPSHNPPFSALPSPAATPRGAKAVGAAPGTPFKG